MELTRADGSSVRVLVVDDEVNIAELLSMALRYEGWDVSMAHTGRQAVSTAAEVKPDAVEDRVAGLTAGGDDYVTKPFSLEEVVARLRALMRRSGASIATERNVLAVGDLTLDEDSREVFRDGVEISLTATEFELLRFLMRNPLTSRPGETVIAVGLR